MSMLPADALFVAGSQNGPNQINTATLTAGTKKPFITGFIAVIGGATAASTVNLTINGIQGGTTTIPVQVQAGAGALPQIIDHSFSVPIPGSPQSNITVVLDALGAGNLTAGVAAFGYTV